MRLRVNDMWWKCVSVCCASPSVLVLGGQLDGLVTCFPCMPVCVRHWISWSYDCLAYMTVWSVSSGLGLAVIQSVVSVAVRRRGNMVQNGINGYVILADRPRQ